MVNISHEPTSQNREIVRLHALVGTPQSMIAKVLGIDHTTLRKYYREELDLSGAQANATIGGVLYKKALSGDTTAMIFWLKTRAGWREVARVDHTSSDGSMSQPARLDLSKLSAATLAELQRAIADADHGPAVVN